MIIDYLSLWPIVAAIALIVCTGLILRNWKAYSLPIRLIPVDVLTIVLLVDLNIKSSSNVTVNDPLMKIEALAFTALFVLILFLPVLWKLAFRRVIKRR